MLRLYKLRQSRVAGTLVWTVKEEIWHSLSRGMWVCRVSGQLVTTGLAHGVGDPGNYCETQKWLQLFLAPGARRPPSCGSPPRTRPWSTSCGGGTSGWLSWPSCSSFCCSSWGSSSTPSRYDEYRRGQGGWPSSLVFPQVSVADQPLCWQRWSQCMWLQSPMLIPGEKPGGPWWVKKSLCFWSLLQTHCKVLTSLHFDLCLIDCFQRRLSSWCRRCCRAGGKISGKHAD